jgi:hypothetical protein
MCTIFPGTFSPLGYAEFRVLCPLTLYTLLVQATLLVGGFFLCKDRLGYMKWENPTFGQVMMEATFLATVFYIFLLALVNVPESGTKAQYISSWADYQVTKLYKLKITNKGKALLVLH